MNEDFSLTPPATQIIKERDVKFLLCSALEGGSNYWYSQADPVLPEDITIADFREGGKFTDPEEYFHWAELVPFHPDCALKMQAGDEGEFRLDRAAMKKGLELMRDKYPRHWANFVNDTADAETGDVFLQVSLFGDIVYG